MPDEIQLLTYNFEAKAELRFEDSSMYTAPSPPPSFVSTSTNFPLKDESHLSAALNLNAAGIAHDIEEEIRRAVAQQAAALVQINFFPSRSPLIITASVVLTFLAPIIAEAGRKVIVDTLAEVFKFAVQKVFSNWLPYFGFITLAKPLDDVRVTRLPASAPVATLASSSTELRQPEPTDARPKQRDILQYMLPLTALYSLVLIVTLVILFIFGLRLLGLLH